MRRFAITLALLFTAAHSSARANSPTTQQWIDQLAAADPADRTAAEIQLRATGKPALNLLQTALEDPRPEVANRARQTMRKIQLFLIPDATDEALSIAGRYIDGEFPAQRKIQLNRLFQLQPRPNAVLTRLVALEPDDDLQHQILYRLGTGYRQYIDRIIADENDPDQVLTLLSGAASMWGAAEAADNAMAQYLTGHTDEQIQICLAEQANGDNVEKERANRQLCFLYRLQGKSKLALQVARQSREQSLVFLVLGDQGDWETAARENDDRWHDPVITAAFRSAFQRMASHRELALQTINAILPATAPDTDDTYSPSKYLLLNDLPERGMECLIDRHPAAVFAMRVSRGEITQAFEIADKYSNNPTDGPLLKQFRDQLRQTLGEMPEQTGTASNWKAWTDAVDDLTQKKYQKAADEFGTLWKADHAHLEGLYLQGFATQAAGDTQHGQALMRRAEMIPLGDPLRRFYLFEKLYEAGLPDAAEHQCNLALRSGGDFDEVGFSEIYSYRAQKAIENKQWQSAIDAVDRCCLITLSPSVQWLDPSRYLTQPALAHLLRARVAREQGNLPDALRELQIYQQYLPASADMVLEWIPALQQLGQHDKADELFNSVYEKLFAICQKYPKSVTYQNQLAWMCACTGRKLDQALIAAEAATKLRPNNWQTLDTLAEVRFRRGDRAAAITLEKQAVSLSEDPYLARQLKRFENAVVPSTTWPGVAPE